MPNYIASGTVNVTAGQTLVTFEDVLLTEARDGDTLELYGANKGRYTLASIGADLVSAQFSVPFDGVTQTDAPYTVRYDSLQRVPPLELADQLRRLRDQIRIFERTAPLYRVQSLGANIPPGAPVAGDMYVVGTVPTGAWAGQAGNLAQWTGSSYLFTPSEPGWLVYSVAAGLVYFRGAADWQPYAAPVGFIPPLISGAAPSEILTAFQAAIDALPPDGGKIIVPAGDYSNLDPGSLSIPLHKMITWEAYDASLPAGMPGVAITSGYQLQPYENSAGTGARPGDAFTRLIVKGHVPDTAQVSQQDSIVYLEGHVPAVEGNLAQEFAAIRMNMSSEMFDSVNNPSNLDIKGLQGVVVGDTGNAKVRSIRTTSVGINGHYGIVTGGMFAAHRSGVIPTEAPFNGNGTDEWTPNTAQAGPYLGGDAAVIAQVGPGIQAAIRMEGFAGIEAPQFGILQGRGAQALRPSFAVIGLHGGGAGHMIQGVVSDTDPTEIFAVTKQGKVLSRGFYSRIITIADDAVATFTPDATSGFIACYAPGTAGAWLIGYFRVGAAVMTPVAVGGQGEGRTTILSGTSGVDGNLTVSALSTGNISIENRTGASRNVVAIFLTN